MFDCKTRPCLLCFEIPLPSLMLCCEVINGRKREPRNLRGVAKGFADLPCRGLREIPVELTYRDDLPDIIKPTRVNLDGR